VSTQAPVKVTVDVVRLAALVGRRLGPAAGRRPEDAGPEAVDRRVGRRPLRRPEDRRARARVAGSGRRAGRRQAGQVKLTIAGSGDVDLLPLVADDVKVSIAGSGDARSRPTSRCSVSIAGSGDVVWAGRHRREAARWPAAAGVTRRRSRGLQRGVGQSPDAVS
jgi:hypothetical protein